MFGKFFASAFEGSMYGAGPEVFALWGYVISHTVNSRVEINPEAVAPKIGMPVSELDNALEYLCKPDPKSRSKLNEGRRMVKEGEFSYFIPNHRAYLMIKKSEDLRKYNARKQREYRAKKSKPKVAPDQAGTLNAKLIEEAEGRGDLAEAERMRKMWEKGSENGEEEQ